MKRPFNWRHGNRNTRGELANWLIQYQTMDGGKLPVVVGLIDPRSRELVRDGHDFLYGDHAYFDRGWMKNNFRVVRNGHHLTTALKRPDDRLKRWNVSIEPWRRGQGRAIVVIPPSNYYAPIYPDTKGWLESTMATLKTVTDRPLHVKGQKGRLRECLLEEHDAFAVVCCISVAGMEAALMGVPVFSTAHCCSWPINAGRLEDIERPEYPDRHDWACGLAYASWNAEELESIDFRDYYYDVKHEAVKEAA